MKFLHLEVEKKEFDGGKVRSVYTGRTEWFGLAEWSPAEKLNPNACLIPPSK